MIIRSKTFKQWLKANFNQWELRDMATYGCVNGFHHLIYYQDTLALYNKFEDEIWERLADEAEESGYTILQYLDSFRDSQSMVDAVTFKNQLVWWMAESLAHEIVYLME